MEKQQLAQYLKLLKHLQHVSPLTWQRTSEILQLISEAGPNEPALARASQAAITAENNVNAFLSQFSGQSPPSPCGHHGQWLSLIQTWDAKIRQYVAAVSKYDAPLVANLGNPLAHQVAIEGIRIGDDLELDLLVNDVINWTALESACRNQAITPPPADMGAHAGDPGACPLSLAPDNKLVLQTPKLVDIKVDCESVEAVIEGTGLVAPFVSGERTVHGETTIFGGAATGVDIGPFSGEMQEGFYVRSVRAASRTGASASRPQPAARSLPEPSLAVLGSTRPPVDRQPADLA